MARSCAGGDDIVEPATKVDQLPGRAARDT
jgi:hypothetical protein